MENKEKAKKEIEELISRFKEHEEAYLQSSYNETQTRRDFIDPFFKSLGWDIDNSKSLAEGFRDVIHEDKVRVQGQLKSPDYSFRLNGKRCFFVEAKKPSVDIKNSISPAYQVRRYAWSAKLGISIVTDFHEFAIYDCSCKPDLKDKASLSRIGYFTFEEYSSKFEFFWDTFSRESVLNGSLEKLVNNKESKRTKSSVDDDFLESLDGWRILLAKDLFECNKSLDEEQLNYLVQQTIDRIVFLRIAEDRNIEPYSSIQRCAESDGVYDCLLELFMRADQKYNSGLFDFTKDSISKTVRISDKTLSKIINDLYFPVSPYEFSVIPVEILGSAYEKFLGKQITIPKPGKIEINEKPEVRKAGGVFYTPEYIVNHMVKNTLGKLIEGKSPKEIEKIKILDPASGSGSFLLGAYEYLLDYHLRWYLKNTKPSKGRKNDPVTPEGNLTTEIKKAILLNNIFGVDIDANAVEVTKLSLLIKCLEGETSASLDIQQKLFHERVLPTLDQNIKCGNSLIDIDYYGLGSDFSEDKKIRPFNWKRGFPEVFKVGGFNVVIGNPPYVFTREQFVESEKEYYAQKYKAMWEKKNTYMLFMEKSFQLISEGGFASFIVPNSWLTIESAKELRKIIIPLLTEVLDLNYEVFKKVSMEPSIFTIKGSASSGKVMCSKISSKEQFLKAKVLEIDRSQWLEGNGRIIVSGNEKSHSLCEKIFSESIPLGSKFDVFTGLQAYEKGKGKPKQTLSDVKNRIYDYDFKFDKDTYKYLNGSDISRYYISWSKTFLRWGYWLSQPRSIDMFKRPRVLVREITGKYPNCLYSVYVDELYLNNKSIVNILHRNDDVLELKFLQAFLNSNLMSYFYKNNAVKSSRKLFPKVVIRNLREFPYPMNIAPDILMRVVKHGESIQKLFMQKPKNFEDKINFHEDEINQLIYIIYQLDHREIDLIEREVHEK
jgi:type I restriction-modification system DNA methylase subunit